MTLDLDQLVRESFERLKGQDQKNHGNLILKLMEESSTEYKS